MSQCWPRAPQAPTDRTLESGVQDAETALSPGSSAPSFSCSWRRQRGRLCHWPLKHCYNHSVVSLELLFNHKAYGIVKVLTLTIISTWVGHSSVKLDQHSKCVRCREGVACGASESGTGAERTGHPQGLVPGSWGPASVHRAGGQRVASSPLA